MSGRDRQDHHSVDPPNEYEGAAAEVNTVIFDYSGTLSLDAVAFGRREHLMAELTASGLAALGVKSTEFFWNEVVNPTWQEGSTTSTGYRSLLERRLQELFHIHSDAKSFHAMKRAASHFVDRYFESCRIDLRWAPLLSRLNEAPAVQVVIATDHYREATEAIIRELARLNISAAALGDAASMGGECSFFVANSADSGVHKSERRFWEIVASKRPGIKEGGVLLVDDFGHNEASGGEYPVFHRVEKRKKDTKAALESVVGSALVVLPFLLTVPDACCGKDEAVDAVIRKTAEQINGMYRN